MCASYLEIVKVGASALFMTMGLFLMVAIGMLWISILVKVCVFISNKYGLDFFKTDEDYWGGQQ